MLVYFHINSFLRTSWELQCSVCDMTIKSSCYKIEIWISRDILRNCPDILYIWLLLLMWAIWPLGLLYSHEYEQQACIMSDIIKNYQVQNNIIYLLVFVIFFPKYWPNYRLVNCLTFELNINLLEYCRNLKVKIVTDCKLCGKNNNSVCIDVEFLYLF